MDVNAPFASFRVSKVAWVGLTINRWIFVHCSFFPANRTYPERWSSSTSGFIYLFSPPSCFTFKKEKIGHLIVFVFASVYKLIGLIMDLITENSGLDLIGIKIFGYLSPEDTFKCCFVSKSWQHFIIENKKRFGCNIITSNLEELVEYLLQCTCRNYSDCQYDLNRYSRNNGRSFSVRLNLYLVIW